MGKLKRCGAMWSDEPIVAMLLGPMNSGNIVEGKNQKGLWLVENKDSLA